MKIIRALRSYLDEIDIVQLPQGTQIGVPRWMLDPVVCERLSQESKARIALPVLIRLLDLVRICALPIHSAVALSGLSPSTKGQHASEENHPRFPGAIASAQEHALASTARADSSAMSTIIDPTHPAGGACNEAGREQR